MKMRNLELSLWFSSVPASTVGGGVEVADMLEFLVRRRKLDRTAALFTESTIRPERGSSRGRQ